MTTAAETRAGGSDGWRRRVITALSPPEATVGRMAGMQSLGYRIQFGLAGAALVVIWAVPGLTTRERSLTTAWLAAFAGYSLIVSQLAVRPGLRVITTFTDVAMILSVGLVVPATMPAARLAVLLVIAYHAHVAGRLAGLVFSLEAFLVVAGSELLLDSANRDSALTVVMYGAVLVALTLLLDGLGRERRHQASQLSRLHNAISSVTAAPELRATLDSVATAARDAVGARFVLIFQPSADELVAQGTTVDLPPDDDFARRALEQPDRSPSAVAMTTGQPVVVADVMRDPRFKYWAPEAERYGFASLIAIPFSPGEGRPGVLNAYFSEPGQPTAAHLDLLVAYCRQAETVVARAIAYEREKEADRLKSEFVGTVSHELRTPLTAILGFGSTLLARWEQIDDDAKRELLQRTVRNAEELRRLVEQVLDFTTLEAGEAELTPRPLALRDEVEQLVHRLEPAMGDHAVDVAIEGAPTVLADARGLERVLSNLLGNAAKFSPPGTSITVTAEPDDDRVLVRVVDQGPGVPAEDEHRVFERFYRTGQPGLVRGTGIGLAVVRSYVQRMGGDVWVERSAEGGACFCFTLPVPPPVASEPPTVASAG